MSDTTTGCFIGLCFWIAAWIMRAIYIGRATGAGRDDDFDRLGRFPRGMYRSARQHDGQSGTGHDCDFVVHLVLPITTTSGQRTIGPSGPFCRPYSRLCGYPPGVRAGSKNLTELQRLRAS